MRHGTQERKPINILETFLYRTGEYKQLPGVGEEKRHFLTILIGLQGRVSDEELLHLWRMFYRECAKQYARGVTAGYTAAGTNKRKHYTRIAEYEAQIKQEQKEDEERDAMPN
jgi:hypothetical protein